MLLAMEQTDLFDKYDTSSLKCVLYGGAPASSSTIKFVQNRYNVTMTAGIIMGSHLSIRSPLNMSCMYWW